MSYCLLIGKDVINLEKDSRYIKFRDSWCEMYGYLKTTGLFTQGLMPILLVDTITDTKYIDKIFSDNLYIRHYRFLRKDIFEKVIAEQIEINLNEERNSHPILQYS